MKWIPSRLSRLLTRPAEERSLLMCGMTLPALLWICLRTMGFTRTLAWIEKQAPVGQPAANRADGRQVAALLRAGSRHAPFGATCLTLALLTRFFLARRGMECQIRIGVRTSATGALEAHAWVQLGDESLDDSAPAGAPFLPFDEAIGVPGPKGFWRTSR